LRGRPMATRDFVPMSVGGILDRTFTIYRENFVRLLAIVAVVYVPIGLINALSISVLFSGTAGTMEFQEAMEGGGPPAEAMDFPSPSPGLMLAGLGGLLIGILLSVVGTNLASGALLRSVSEYYLGRETTVGEAYRFVLPKLGTIIWAGVLVAIVVLLGLMLLCRASSSDCGWP
jgi:hypothetical protein